MYLLPLSLVLVAAAYAAVAISATPLNAPRYSSSPPSGSSSSSSTLNTDVSEYNFDDSGYTYCQAPFPSKDSYTAIPDAEVELVQLVVRHGDRTTEHILPNEDTTWTCDGVEDDMYLHGAQQPKQNTTGSVKQVIIIPEWNKKYGYSNQIWKGSCESGQLTDRGKSQHRFLGSQLRGIYVDKLGFLPSKLEDLASVYVRTTYYWRTKNSVESLLGGLWPNRGYSSDDAIPLHSLPQRIEDLYGNSDACPKVDDLYNQIIGSSHFLDFLKEEKPLMTKLNSNFGEEGGDWTSNWNNQVDVLLPRHCHGMKLPCNSPNKDCPTDADVAQAMRNGHYQYAYTYRDNPLAHNFTRLSIGSFLGTLNEQRQAHIAGKSSKVKLAIYSAHDTSIAPILGVLKASNRSMLWPPYASNIAFELWKKKDGSRVIRVIHNGHTLKIMPGNRFNEYIQNYIPQNITAECAAK
ncbi:phosphoglycerate mutase-like protein [Martensiomyces pterosporus]|nr:phosphoglycerate mutase-like protein [Martensiomyces pterosporus]